MYRIFKVIIVTGLFFSFACTSLVAMAQNSYKGNYYGKNKAAAKESELEKPVPKIFSSKLTSVDQAQKLDILYNNLLTSLWVYASTDFIYQKKLYSLIKPETFKLTRYSKEFTGDLEDSMVHLNENYKNMLSDISNTEKEYEEIKEGIKEVDYEILEPLWDEKIGHFRERMNKYFQMQNKYLNTYRNLVGFILKENGGYYFDTNEKKVYFYKFGGYKFYGQSIDSLRKISFEQRELLRTIAPVNTDIKFK